MTNTAPRTIRERGILFSAPMVRAILHGRKTQTRRLVTPQPPSVEAIRAKAGTGFHLSDIGERGLWRVMGPVWAVRELMAGDPVGPQWRCSYGVPGDRLWVRETFAARVPGCEEQGGVSYRADHFDPRGDGPAHPMRWRPAIYMPRAFSRITLEITDVRVQRLQTIREEDARAEGAESDAEMMRHLGHLRGADAARSLPSRLRSARQMFAALWDEINERAPWSSNPWVWALTFRRVNGDAAPSVPRAEAPIR